MYRPMDQTSSQDGSNRVRAPRRRRRSQSMTAIMNAIVRTRYGSPDVLEVNKVDKPTPTDDQVLVKVHAASLNVADHYQLRSRPLFVRMLSGTGLLRPKDPR